MLAGVSRSLLLSCCSALLELLDAAGLVERAVFTGVERVGLARDFNHDLRVLLTLMGTGLAGADGGTDEEYGAR